MFNGKGYDLSDIAAVTRTGDGMFGGDGAWWILLLFFVKRNQSSGKSHAYWIQMFL